MSKLIVCAGRWPAIQDPGMGHLFTPPEEVFYLLLKETVREEEGIVQNASNLGQNVDELLR